MKPHLLLIANRAAGAWISRLGRRRMIAAAALAVAAAILSGSFVVALAPMGLLVVVALLRFQSLERLMVFTVGATLLLDHPSEVPFARRWHSPLQPLGELWFHPLRRTIPLIPVPFAPALLLVGWLLFRSITSPQPRLDATGRLFLRTCLLAVASLGVAEVYGLAHGGDLQQTLYQVVPLLGTVAVAAAASLLASTSLLRNLERVLLLAAGARAVVAIYVYVTVFRPANKSYLYVSTHSDSVLWVVAVALLIGRIVTTFRLQPQRGRIALALLLLVAITVNNRRLAWVELGVIVAYAFWAVPSRLRRLRGRVGVAVIPLLALYTAAGLAAPPSRLFLPVQALSSVNDSEDSSTLAREIENHNLIVTIRESGPLGLGFGHEYDEQVVGPDISKAFAQYRYLPHNSVLGLWAFAGPLGFIGFWLPLIVGMAAAARLRRHRSQHLRAAGIWLAGSIVAFALMAWGDIGLQSSLNGLIGGLGAGLAVGLGRERGRRQLPDTDAATPQRQLVSA